MNRNNAFNVSVNFTSILTKRLQLLENGTLDSPVLTCVSVSTEGYLKT